jgi:recombination protein RecA
MSLENVKKLLEKNVKGIHVSVMADSDLSKSSEFIKTPSLDLNRILSGNLFKGIPNRQLVGITGPEHTMKSSFMILCMAEAIRQGYSPVIIDTEGGVKDEFCRRWGLDLAKVLYIYTPWISKIQTILASLKESGEKKLIIGLDSVGGIDKIGSYESALNDDPKSDQGQLQRQIRSMLKLMLNICIEQDSIGIVTSHMYARPGLIPMPDEISGGKAMKLFPSILIQLKKTSIKNADKQVIGNEITASTIKNRIYPPFQTATVSIDYMKGINPYAGLIDLGITAGIIQKSGSWYSYKDEKLGQGETNASANIANFPNLLNDINKWLETTKYSSVDENIKLAEETVSEYAKIADGDVVAEVEQTETEKDDVVDIDEPKKKKRSSKKI